jgi:hypothetical protein
MSSWAVISSEAVMNGAMLNGSKVGVAARGKCNLMADGCNNTAWNKRTHPSINGIKATQHREHSLVLTSGNLHFKFQTAKNIKRWFIPCLCLFLAAGRCKPILETIPHMKQPNISTRRCQAVPKDQYVFCSTMRYPNLISWLIIVFPIIPYPSKNCHCRCVNPPSLGQNIATNIG